MDREKKEIYELLRVCKKIIQAYRIRLNCMNIRYNLLVSIDHNFNNISNPNFFNTLDNILKKEIKVLEIVRSEEKGSMSNIVYAIEHLKEYRSRWDINSQYKIKLKGTRSIQTGKLYSFLGSCIKFLNKIQKDFGKIEKRIKTEEIFLEKGNRNPEYFNKFILAWGDEVKSNKKLIGHFNNIIKKNRDVIEWGKEAETSGGGTVAIVGGLLGGSIGVAVSLKAMESPSTAAWCGGIATVIILAGLFVNLMDFTSDSSKKGTNGLFMLDKEKGLIRDIEKIRSIKKPLWDFG